MSEENKTKRTMRFVVSNCPAEVVEKLKSELSPDIVTRIIDDLATEAIDFEKNSGRPQSLIKTLNYLTLLSQKEGKVDSESTPLISNQKEIQSSNVDEIPIKSESLELDTLDDTNDAPEQVITEGVSIDTDAITIGSMFDMFSSGEPS